MQLQRPRPAGVEEPSSVTLAGGPGGGAAMSGVEAALLAGGAGTRLRSVSGGLPKALCEVAGQPFVAHLLRQIRTAGVARCVLCTGYGGDRLEAVLGSSCGGSLRLEYSREPVPCGTAGALRHALRRLAAPRLLIMNADSYVRTSLARFVAWQRDQAFPAALVAVRARDASSFGRLVIDPATQLVKSFGEKQPAAGPAWVSAGVYLLPRSLLLDIPEGRFVSLEREMFPAWAAQGRLGGYRVDTDFVDIGTPGRLVRARKLMRGWVRVSRAGETGGCGPAA